MSKGYRVHFVGLKLFAKRTADNLSQFDPENSYVAYDTYYSKRDQFRFLRDLNKADLVYSLNGSALPSKVFKLSMNKGIPLVMHWMGTDVLRTIEARANKAFNQNFLDYAHHVTETTWLKEELSQLKVDAELVRYASVPPMVSIEPWSRSFEMLTYLGNKREEFYGLHRVIELALALPNVNFNIVGTELKGVEIPSNVKVHGWVDNMEKFVDRSVVLLRLTEHDGLANSVLEAMAKGRYVLFTYSIPGAQKDNGIGPNLEWIKSLMAAHEKEELPFNEEGKAFVEATSNSDTVNRKLVEYIESVISK